MKTLDRRVTVLETALVLLPAGLFFGAAAMPSAAVISGILLLFFLLWPYPIRFPDRIMGYVLLAAALLLTVTCSRLFPVADDRFNFMAALLHPELVVPFLLYAAALSTLLCRPEFSLGISAAASLVTLAFCGELHCFQLTDYMLPERIPHKAILLKELYPAAVVFAAIVLFLMLRKVYGRGRGWLRSMAVLSAGVLVFALAWGMMASRGFWEEKLREFENLLLASEQNSHWQLRKTLWFDNAAVNLDEMLRPEMRERESEIVLQAIGSTPPGYLRGRGFCIYRYGGKWESGPDIAGTFSERAAGVFGDERVFVFPGAAAPVRSWVILPQSFILQEYLWCPEAAAELELSADKVCRAEDGTVMVRHGRISRGYTVRSGNSGGEALALGEDPFKVKNMRQIPYELVPVLREVCYAEKVNASLPEAERIRRLLHFFQSSFQYSLVPMPSAGDPVAHFLLRSRRGHCELFASAMVLLLRFCGIPARYVTGFICTEEHAGHSFVARMGNAHAWAEAYDSRARQWVRVEPTPPVPPIPARENEFFQHYYEAAELYGSEILSALHRGHIGDAALALLNAFYLLLTNGLVLLTAGAAAGLTGVVILWRRCRSRRRNGKFAAVPERRGMIRDYRRFLWKMRLCRRIPLKSSPTVQEMLAILQTTPLRSPEKQTAALQFLRRYREERYRP